MNQKVITLRMPPELWKQIAQSADKSYRSVNNEIVSRLSVSVETDNRSQYYQQYAQQFDQKSFEEMESRSFSDIPKDSQWN